MERGERVQLWLAAAMKMSPLFGGKLPTATELSKASGVGRQKISEILNGQGADESTVTRLAVALGAPIPLLDRWEPPGDDSSSLGLLRSAIDALLRVEHALQAPATVPSVGVPIVEAEAMRRELQGQVVAPFDCNGLI